MTSITITITKTITLLFLIASLVQVQAFSLNMVTPFSKGTTIKAAKTSSTKLSYARSNDDGSSTLTMDPRKVSVSTTRKPKQAEADPIQMIAFLNDPSRRYKKSRRPRMLSDFDRQRRAFAKAAEKAQAMAKFQEGQRAAERAILSVLEEHNIQDPFIMS